MMRKDPKKIIQYSALILFFLLIVVYAFFRSRDLIFGVKIKNVNIVDGSTVAESVLHVSGQAKNAIKLTLNGREITVDEDGNWNETIALLSGYNVINVTAKDKFGYVDEKNYKLMH